MAGNIVNCSVIMINTPVNESDILKIIAKIIQCSGCFIQVCVQNIVILVGEILEGRLDRIIILTMKLSAS